MSGPSAEFRRRWAAYGDELRAGMGPDAGIDDLLAARREAHLKAATDAISLARHLLTLADIEHLPAGRVAVKHVRYVLDDLRKLADALRSGEGAV